MFKSILDEVKSAFYTGNMVLKIVIINVIIYMVLALIGAFAPSFYAQLTPYLAISGNLGTFFNNPWTILTHMFVHDGFWHMGWNMLIFYWFGNIVGDLVGDKRILPIYILGGLVGALFYMISFQLLDHIGLYAVGASAAVMAIVFSAVAVAPDYQVSLILIGPVRIKYIGLFILFFDLIGTQGSDNTGGHIAHLGGTLFGFLFIYFLKDGIDLSSWEDLKRRFFGPKVAKKTSKLRVEYKASDSQRKMLNEHRKDKFKRDVVTLSDKVDMILDKIKQTGYDSLSDEEKEILYQASKDE